MASAMATTVPPMCSPVAAVPVSVPMVPAAVVVVAATVTAATARPDIDAAVAIRWRIVGPISVSRVGISVARGIRDTARQSGH